MVANPSTFVNTISSVILELIHQVLDNLGWTYIIKETYMDEDELWIVLLAGA